jgi:hypothetical protein
MCAKYCATYCIGVITMNFACTVLSTYINVLHLVLALSNVECVRGLQEVLLEVIGVEIERGIHAHETADECSVHCLAEPVLFNER